jgi:ParB-like chromosome segregation protein Spo0J
MTSMFDQKEPSLERVTRVRISSIHLRPRPDPLDRKKVTRYRQTLRRGDVFPAIWVEKFLTGRYELMDGYHRYHAHRLEGRKTIQIYMKVVMS